jgi:periplasmic divalent cation tolerance protein
VNGGSEYPSSERKAKALGGTNFNNGNLASRSDGRCSDHDREWRSIRVLESRQGISRRHFVSGDAPMANARMVLTSVGSLEKAEQLAGILVERRLAACVNIVGPVRSIYRWKNAIEREQEYLLLIKTTAERAAELAAAFAEIHPYELPERVEVSIDGGSDNYLEWLSAQVTRDPSQ